VAADLIRVAMTAAGSEPDLAAFVERGESFRRSAQRPLVEQWELRRVLAQGASVDEAADLMWTMTSPGGLSQAQVGRVDGAADPREHHPPARSSPAHLTGKPVAGIVAG